MTDWKGIAEEAQGTWSCAAAEGEPCEYCVSDLRTLLRRAQAGAVRGGVQVIRDLKGVYLADRVAIGDEHDDRAIGCAASEGRLMDLADAIERGEVDV